MTTKNKGITPLNADTFDIDKVEISDKEMNLPNMDL